PLRGVGPARFRGGGEPPAGGLPCAGGRAVLGPRRRGADPPPLPRPAHGTHLPAARPLSLGRELRRLHADRARRRRGRPTRASMAGGAPRPGGARPRPGLAPPPRRAAPQTRALG